jgi:predicted CXXCH cytochrome family protein
VTLRCVLAVLLTVTPTVAQDIDSANFGRNAAPSPADNAESKSERDAFGALLSAKQPQQKKSLALEFATRFPTSWLLATAWQMAAAACVDLEDSACVVKYARRSIELRPENPLLLIALARAELISGEAARAKSDARDALLWLSVLAGPSGVRPAEWDKTRGSLEEYTRRIAGPGAPQLSPAQRQRKEEFAGSESCRPCHKAVFESWQQTGMAKMLRPRQEAGLLADFSRTIEIGEARIGGAGRPWFEIRTPDKSWKRYSVDYAIGSKWQQAYATSLPDGRLFVFPLQFNALSKEWLNYWQIIDPPGSERARVGHFPDLSEATSYQRNCAVCHTSQLHLTQQGDATMERAAFREPGVNCEMCHGASARHAAEMKSGKTSPHAGAEPPFRFESLDHVNATLICGQCHRQSALRNLGPSGEMNFTPDSPFFARLLSDTAAELSPRAVYKDGRFRETTFIGEAFMRSACFLRGQAQCASCHNPHPANAQSNPVSLKFSQDPDRMCLQCHQKLAESIPLHTRHAQQSAGSRCTACHMPPIMNALSFRAASHQISDIPSAGLVARFGAEQSPNACLLCHRDKTANWLKEQLAQYRREP